MIINHTFWENMCSLVYRAKYRLIALTTVLPMQIPWLEPQHRREGV